MHFDQELVRLLGRELVRSDVVVSERELVAYDEATYGPLGLVSEYDFLACVKHQEPAVFISPVLRYLWRLNHRAAPDDKTLDGTDRSGFYYVKTDVNTLTALPPKASYLQHSIYTRFLDLDRIYLYAMNAEHKNTIEQELHKQLVNALNVRIVQTVHVATLRHVFEQLVNTE